ncbi:MAG: PRC-barrel domain-containing protein [Bryobacteraceae bacterium]
MAETKYPEAHTLGESEGGLRKRAVLSASSLASNRVRNRTGEDVGTIKDLMIDIYQGRVAYAVLSFGGFLGLGDKLFAVPWDKLRVDEVNREIIIDATREQLERAPGFKKDNWPDMTDPDWEAQIRGHYGGPIAPESGFEHREGRDTYGDEGSPTAGTGVGSRPDDRSKKTF